jgi:O-antigen ligase
MRFFDQGQSSRLALLTATLIVVAAAAAYRIPLAVGLFNSLSILDLILLSALVPAVLLLAGGRAVSLGDPTIFACLLLPAAISLLSCLWSHELEATIRAVVVYVESLVAYLAAVSLLAGARPAAIARLFALFAWVLVAVSVLMYAGVPGFEPYFSPDSPDYAELTRAYFGRLSHPFIGASNNLAGVLALLLFPLAAAARELRSRFAYATTVVTVVALLLTLSRGVIAAVAICVIVGLVWRRGPSLGLVAKTALGAGVLAAGAYIALLLVPSLQENLKSRLSLFTILERLRHMSEVTNAIASQPLVGFGAGVAPNNAPWLVGAAHNTYLENAMYFGIPLAALITIALLLLPARLYVRFSSLGSAPSLVRACFLGIVCQLLVFVTQTAFEGSNLKIIFYLLIGMSVALLRASSEERAAVERPDN